MQYPFPTEVSSRRLLAGSLAGLVAIVALDMVTPPDLELTPLYVLPIVLTALRGADRDAVGMAFVAGICASVMDQWQGRFDVWTDSIAAISLSFTWLALFGVIGLGVSSWVQRHRDAAKLECALEEVRIYREMLPICAWCKRIRDDRGGVATWHTIEEHLHAHAQTRFTHGICPTCAVEAVREHRARQGKIPG